MSFGEANAHRISNIFSRYKDVEIRTISLSLLNPQHSAGRGDGEGETKVSGTLYCKSLSCSFSLLLDSEIVNLVLQAVPQSLPIFSWLLLDKLESVRLVGWLAG